jgi:hypothetical protein
MLWLDTDNNGTKFIRLPIAPTCALNLYLLAADLWHSSNGMPAYLRRVLLTRWVGEAVRIINADTERMRRMFERTGCAPHHSTTPHHTTLPRELPPSTLQGDPHPGRVRGLENLPRGPWRDRPHRRRPRHGKDRCRQSRRGHRTAHPLQGAAPHAGRRCGFKRGPGCASGCASGCGSGCAFGCASGCGSGCASGCAFGCGSGCASGCASGCGSGCASGCASGCCPV